MGALAEDEGPLGAADTALLRPKKSTAGAAGLGGGCAGLGVLDEVSSNDILALFFCSEGGRRKGFADGFEVDGAGAASSSSASTSADAYGLNEADASSCVDGMSPVARLDEPKTRPGPPPPPRTLCFGRVMGVFVFGAGSMPNSDDFPEPAVRAFFVGLSSMKSSSSSS